MHQYIGTKGNLQKNTIALYDKYAGKKKLAMVNSWIRSIKVFVLMAESWLLASSRLITDWLNTEDCD